MTQQPDLIRKLARDAIREELQPDGLIYDQIGKALHTFLARDLAEIARDSGHLTIAGKLRFEHAGTEQRVVGATINGHHIHHLLSLTFNDRDYATLVILPENTLGEEKK